MPCARGEELSFSELAEGVQHGLDVGRKRRFDLQPLARYRVGKTDPPCMKRLPSQ